MLNKIEINIYYMFPILRDLRRVCRYTMVISVFGVSFKPKVLVNTLYVYY